MEYLTSAKLNIVMTGEHGYTRLKSQISRSGIQINIFKKDIEGITAVVLEIPPPRYDFPHIEPETEIQKIQENFFEDLKNTMEEMLGLGLKISAIVFHGGGTMDIPDRFKKFCEDKGIQILTYNPNPENADNRIIDDEFKDGLTETESKIKETKLLKHGY